jgi:hypothetical protein
MMSNTKLRSASATTDLAGRPHLVPAASRARHVLWALSFLLGLLCAQPAMAQFSATEGVSSSGAPQLTAELQPFVWLPATNASIGLDRPPGTDLVVNLPRPTISDVVGSLDGAFSCACLVRYGNWVGEVNIEYVAVHSSEFIAPILPGGTGATLNSHLSVFYISPGIGYRVASTSDLSLDARVGFSYTTVSVSAAFAKDRLGGISHSSDFIQPWIGERLDYFPSPKWRLENTFALTGLGVAGGEVGWNARVGVSYLVSKWFDVSAGYLASQTFRDETAGPNGANNNVNLMQYGPYVAAGFRF